MRVLLGLATALVVWLPLDAMAQCTNLPAGCPTCTMCTYPPATGTQPSLATINGLMEELASNSLGSRGPTLRSQEQGATRTGGTAQFPCVLFKAVGVVESSWRQFCDAGSTVISFDCGYGISQITSGVSNYTNRVASEPAWNMGAGADILLTKWNAETTYGGKINDSNPVVVENWYYAAWAYNGFTNGNNPNNPSHPANRPPYGGPGALSRGSYPYQELVWGRIRYPLQDAGANVYEPVTVTYPNLADIPPPPSGTSLFEQDITINPQHANPCVDPCAQGCPTPRELIVDNLDPGFSITGTALTAATGGYLDSFNHAPVQPAGAPTVVATFTPMLPASGVWEVAGYIPLTPATSQDIPVEVEGVGGAVTWRMDQSVRGGVFQVLGSAKLRAGHTLVRVRNDSGDTGEDVGFDAIRWRWLNAGGAAGQGGACASSADCSGELMCAGATCQQPCWLQPCAAGVCNDATGVCDTGGGSSSTSGGPGSSAAPSSAGQGTSNSVTSGASSTAGGTSGAVVTSSSGAAAPEFQEPERPWWRPACSHSSVGERAPFGALWVLGLTLLRCRSNRRRR